MINGQNSLWSGLTTKNLLIYLRQIFIYIIVKKRKKILTYDRQGMVVCQLLLYLIWGQVKNTNAASYNNQQTWVGCLPVVTLPDLGTG